MPDYPIPSYAAYIWSTPTTINLGLPPLPGNDRQQTITIPLSPEGLLVALDIIKARSAADDLRIGTRASPTRSQVEAMLREAKGYHPPKQQASINDLFQEDTKP